MTASSRARLRFPLFAALCWWRWCSFRFAHTLNVFTGFAGLIVGIIAVLIDARTGGKWYLSVGLLVVFGLITAVNVS